MKNNQALFFVSNYPSGNWVCTSAITGDTLTSECDWGKQLEFAHRNDTSPEALAQAQEFTWPVEMFEAALACQAPSVAPPMLSKKRSVWQNVLAFCFKN